MGRHAAKERLGLDLDKFWLVFAGRIVEEKGLDDLIDALGTGTSPRVAVTVLGSGPHLASLRQHGQSLVEQGRLLFRAQVPSTDVPEYLRAADVMCLPSRTEKNWKEQFGRILVEAMAAEAVVLGSSSGEIPNVIADAGMTFQERNVEDLRSKINFLAEQTILGGSCDGAS
jgi:glycosyltransferase involved in cell wall biosynthesis